MAPSFASRWLWLAMMLFVGTSPARSADWEIALESSAPREALSTALLGQYDLSGELLAYSGEPGLVGAMQPTGFSDWRVGVGRWEASTRLLPTLSDGSPCPIPIPESAASEGDDLALIASRDWFSDDGDPVTLSDTQDDARYRLDYLRAVLDEVDAFGATPFVSIDSMPRALAVNRTPERTDCAWTFQNRVSNVRPADAAVFAAAAAGMVQRIVEGDVGGAARAIAYWEVWNEPEFPQFWDPAFEDQSGPLDRYFEMAIETLLALDGYRASSAHPNAAGLRFGLGSFGTAAVAATTLSAFDSAPVPGGHVPLDFISFHAYSDDPLDVANAVDVVAQAAAATANYTDVELVLAEWGPNLTASAGDPVYAASIEPALHVATVLALGAASGLDRAHRAIFWDFYPDSIRLGVLDHDQNERSAFRAYELLAKMIPTGATRLSPIGMADGRLDSGLGAVLASVDAAGITRLLFVNRNGVDRTARVRLDGALDPPTRAFRYDDPTGPIAEFTATGPALVIPAESIVLVEYEARPVPMLETSARLLILTLLVAGAIFGVRRRRRASPRAAGTEHRVA